MLEETTRTFADRHAAGREPLVELRVRCAARMGIADRGTEGRHGEPARVRRGGHRGRFETEVVIGSAAAELARLSAATDLLVIGSRRWGSIARVVSGSTGEALLHGGSCCPVLLVARPRTT